MVTTIVINSSSKESLLDFHQDHDHATINLVFVTIAITIITMTMITPTQVITSEGNSLRLEFLSDNSVQKNGFAAIFFTDKVNIIIINIIIITIIIMIIKIRTSVPLTMVGANTSVGTPSVPITAHAIRSQICNDIV